MSLVDSLFGAGQPQAPSAGPDLSILAGAPSTSTTPAPNPSMPVVESSAPPAPDPRIGQFLDTAQQLHNQAAQMKPPNYPGMSIGQAIVGIGGALATSGNPHAQFVAGFMPALANAVQRQFGNSEQAWQVGRQSLLDQANVYQQRAAGLQQWQEDMYKAQMGVYGQQVRGVGAAQVRAASDDASPAIPVQAGGSLPNPDPSVIRTQMLRATGVPPDAATRYLPAVTRFPDADATTWAANQATADELLGQAGKVIGTAPDRSLDLGNALFTVSAIGKAAQALHAQVPALRAAQMGLIGQRAAVDPASDAAQNLQASIDQYSRAIQANGAQLDRLAGASKQVSNAIAQRSAAFAPIFAPQLAPVTPDLSGQIGPNGTTVSVTPISGQGANAVNQANANAPLSLEQIIARLRDLGYTVR